MCGDVQDTIEPYDTRERESKIKKRHNECRNEVVICNNKKSII